MEQLLPKNFNTMDESTQKRVVAYLEQLTPIERMAYKIGIEHLGTSFNLLKSNGYIAWISEATKHLHIYTLEDLKPHLSV